jgi:hypothetical protein
MRRMYKKQTSEATNANGRSNYATKILEFVHFNVCGSIETLSIRGTRYFLILIDKF